MLSKVGYGSLNFKKFWLILKLIVTKPKTICKYLNAQLTFQFAH